jgi:hypothetical protein
MTHEMNAQLPSPRQTRPHSWWLGLEGRRHSPRILFWKALFGLLAFDVLGLGRNFTELNRMVSRWKVSARTAPEGTNSQVCEAINRACVWYPKRVRCLQRSAVTTCLLRDYGIPGKMVVGAQNLPFKAHAWTEVDGTAVNERRDVQKIYQVLDCW